MVLKTIVLSVLSFIYWIRVDHSSIATCFLGSLRCGRVSWGARARYLRLCFGDGCWHKILHLVWIVCLYRSLVSLAYVNSVSSIS